MWLLETYAGSVFHVAGECEQGGNGDTNQVQCHSTCFLRFICWEAFVLTKSRQKTQGPKQERCLYTWYYVRLKVDQNKSFCSFVFVFAKTIISTLILRTPFNTVS